MRNHLTKTLILTAALSWNALAQDNSTPPPAPRADDVRQNHFFTRRALAQAGKTETLAYAGVSTSAAPAVLTEQLRLPRGMGLVVDFVEPASPAEAAGLKPYDVLTALDDQRLANPEQLRALVRLRKANDAVKVTLIRRGESQVVTVTLGQREAEVGVDDADGRAGERHNTFAVAPGEPLRVFPATFELPKGGGGITLTNVNGQPQTVWSDDRHTLTLEMKDGKAATLDVKDRDGKQQFHGPVATDEQRKALPGDLAEKLAKAEAAGPLQFRLYTGAMAAAGGELGRPRVLTSQVKDALMFARVENGKAAYVLAVSTADGKTLFDGPAATDEQRKAMPEAVAAQLGLLEKNAATAPEFGTVGRN